MLNGIIHVDCENTTLSNTQLMLIISLLCANAAQ